MGLACVITVESSVLCAIPIVLLGGMLFYFLGCNAELATSVKTYPTSVSLVFPNSANVAQSPTSL